jgi:hypothetical protein
MYKSRLTKPKVGEVKQWIPHDNGNEYVQVFTADIDDFFFKVGGSNVRTKYFYGENAWADSRRYADDMMWAIRNK